MILNQATSLIKYPDVSCVQVLWPRPRPREQEESTPALLKRKFATTLRKLKRTSINDNNNSATGLVI